MNVLQKVHHPHTVQFFGAVTKQTPYMIVTEFMSCGSMSDMFRCALKSRIKNKKSEHHVARRLSNWLFECITALRL
jgi:serine/threonine protein kinase